MPDGLYLHSIPVSGEIYPGSHLSYKMKLHVPQGIDYKMLHDPGVKAVLNEITRYGRMLRTINLQLIDQDKFEMLVHHKAIQLIEK